MKYLIWLLILVAVVVWLKRAKKSMMGGPGAAPGGTRRPPAAPQVERIVQCAHCHVHFPASEAVVDAAGNVFCGEEHKQLSTI
ncbi:PP0621 family protein [Herbaspirillum sp. RTI4]|uniref:PP0621 family protein n=1 Tax=Herbaspirillum sp. RTI4 TaxID=3048640 RepID=UPI002AB4BD34|nr:PP0621 family protein [Herbaspirillum sp. RTI4]MDY7577513.1 PP0621 family protein [Herbaspirillum sp. RTI4]MEA9980988.1 PP0621 family protein [Herbaspirillum sp. RTI4]